MTKGRKKTTGRFDSREELVKEVWIRYHTTPQNVAQIARFCRVSDSTVHNILTSKEGMP